MTQPLPDKAEISLDCSDTHYAGTFERAARFDAHLDEAGISLLIERRSKGDACASVHMRFHYVFFAAILHELAKKVSAELPPDAADRDALYRAAKELLTALAAGADRDKRMTGDEAMLLAHLME